MMTSVASLPDTNASVEDVVRRIAVNAKTASHALGLVDGATRDAALQAGADAIRASHRSILTANEKDMLFARKKGLSDAMLDLSLIHI